MHRLTPSLLAYAARLHAGCAGSHHVASPLGAWTLLALLATSADGHQTRTALEDALGTDLPSATQAAAELLASPHPEVATAAAAWLAPEVDRSAPAVSAWLRALPAEVDRGPLPRQTAADAWAQRHTLDLVDRFPLDLETDPPLVVVATALASRVSWHEAFDVVASAELGPGPFAAAVSGALHTAHGLGHRGWVATTDGHEDIGDVAVHVGDAGRGLRVSSVVGAPEAPPAAVLAAAHRVATDPEAPRRSLFDLPLGDSPCWRLGEERRTVHGGPARQERVASTTLPAWSAASDHDLLEIPGLGFDAGVDAVAAVLGLTDPPASARQVAVARYHREGFEAAAVSAMMAGRAAVVEQEAVIRTAHLRFPHPYAVVAVTAGPWAPGGGRSADGQPGPWDGLPVFSAWVATPDEP